MRGRARGIPIDTVEDPRPLPPTVYVGFEDQGVHNKDIQSYIGRLSKLKAHRNASTLWVMPTRKNVHPRVVQAWMFLTSPQNALTGRIFPQGFSIADGYNAGIEALFTPPFTEFRYLLTLDDDNIPPRDGLLNLLGDICPCETPCRNHYSVVGGLYWSKERDVPLIFGDPNDPKDFTPQIPRVGEVQECNGLGMGFTLVHTGLFRMLQRPWFKETETASCDLYFMQNLRNRGYRVACDTNVQVGHLNLETGEVK